MAEWTLRDMDNRDDDGAPWETTAAPAGLIPYLDGPLRADLSETTDPSDLDDLIAAFRDEDLALAKDLGKPFGIYVDRAAATSEEGR